jgi:hypothetical protein
MSSTLGFVSLVVERSQRHTYNLLQTLEDVHFEDASVSMKRADVNLMDANVDFTGATVTGLPGAGVAAIPLFWSLRLSAPLVVPQGSVATIVGPWSSSFVGGAGSAQFNEATGQLTVVVGGVYDVSSSLTWNNSINNNGARIMRIMHHDSATATTHVFAQTSRQPNTDRSINDSQILRTALRMEQNDMLWVEVVNTSLMDPAVIVANGDSVLTILGHV